MWGTKQITTYHLHQSVTYADVVKYYEAEERVKRGDPNTKWLGKDKTQHVTRHDNGAVAFYLRTTEMVRFHPDDTISVSWHRPNANDVRFVNSLTPYELEFQLDRIGCRNVVGIRYPWESTAIHGGMRYWKAGPTPTFSRDSGGAWQVKTPTTPFMVPKLDRRAATAALKRSGARDFATWATATAHIGWTVQARNECKHWFDPIASDYRARILNELSVPEHWSHLLFSASLTNYAKDGLTAARRATLAVRKAVYATTPGVVTWETHECLDTKDRELARYLNLVKEYAYALPKKSGC